MGNASFRVQDIAQRSNRNLFLICAIVIIAVIAAAALSANYFYNFFNGPFTINAKDLLAITDIGAQKQYYVRFKADDVVDTGYQYVTEHDSGSTTINAYYVAVFVGDKFVIAKTSTLDLSAREFTGALVEFPSDMQREVVDDITRQYPDVKDSILPFMLDTSDFHIGGYIGIGVGGVVLALALWGLIRALLRMQNVERHPILRNLQRFGDPQAVAEQIEAEMSQNHPVVGKLHLTQHWLLQKGGASLNAIPLKDVLWVYKKVTQHRTNGIPTGKTYSALICDRHGKVITINGKDGVVNDMLSAVLQHAPWALAGYSPEIEKAWRKERQQLIAAVDQRRGTVQQYVQ